MEIKIKDLVELLDAHIAAQQAKALMTDEHPIANAMDRAHAQGGQLALINFKNALLDVVTNAYAAVGAAEEKRA